MIIDVTAHSRGLTIITERSSGAPTERSLRWLSLFECYHAGVTTLGMP